MENKNNSDIIIIGAGYAGVSAGKKLNEANKEFLILESRDRIGGRVYTSKSSKGYKVDLGAGK